MALEEVIEGRWARPAGRVRQQGIRQGTVRWSRARFARAARRSAPRVPIVQAGQRPQQCYRRGRRVIFDEALVSLISRVSIVRFQPVGGSGPGQIDRKQLSVNIQYNRLRAIGEGRMSAPHERHGCTSRAAALRTTCSRAPPSHEHSVAAQDETPMWVISSALRQPCPALNQFEARPQ